MVGAAKIGCRKMRVIKNRQRVGIHRQQGEKQERARRYKARVVVLTPKKQKKNWFCSLAQGRMVALVARKLCRGGGRKGKGLSVQTASKSHVGSLDLEAFGLCPAYHVKPHHPLHHVPYWSPARGGLAAVEVSAMCNGRRDKSLPGVLLNKLAREVPAPCGKGIRVSRWSKII